MYVFPSCVVVVIRLYLRPCPLKELYANGGIFAGRGSTKSLITNKVCSSISNFFCFICISRRCWRARYGSVDNLSKSHKLDFQPFFIFPHSSVPKLRWIQYLISSIFKYTNLKFLLSWQMTNANTTIFLKTKEFVSIFCLPIKLKIFPKGSSAI